MVIRDPDKATLKEPDEPRPFDIGTFDVIFIMCCHLDRL